MLALQLPAYHYFLMEKLRDLKLDGCITGRLHFPFYKPFPISNPVQKDHQKVTDGAMGSKWN